MDITQLIPTPDPLPAPWWLMNILLVLTFVLHLLLANALVGAGVIAFFRNLGRRKPQALDWGGPGTGRKLTIVLALTVNLGVAPLLFMQVLYGQFIYVSSVLMAVFWLSIFILVILAYYAIYLYEFKFAALAGARTWIMGLAMVLLLIVGYFFTNSLVIMINPPGWVRYFGNQGGTVLHVGDPSMLPRYLHFVLSSVALGGLAMSLWGWWRARRHAEDRQELISQGLLWFAVSSLLNLVVGGWYLAALPNAAVAKVVGGNPAALYSLVLGAIAGVAAITAGFSRNLWPTLVGALASVVFMALFRDAVRRAYLEPYLDLGRAPVATQTIPLIIFLVVLVVGVIVVARMLKMASAAAKEAN